ncbi:MAG: DUF2793 domain-containing protein [Blastomonas sp.]
MPTIVDAADMTARLGLPLIHPGQAQKEVAHNEALALFEIAIATHVEGVANDPSALTPDAGQCWIVGPSPLGEWAGFAGHVMGWTAGGWRAAAPMTGMRVYSSEIGASLFFDGTGWTGTSLPDAPAGGAVVDTEARACLADLISSLQSMGLLSPA